MALQQLASSADLRRELSATGRQLVIDRFSLRRAAKLQEQIYLSAVEDRTSLFEQTKDFAYTATGVSGRILRRRFAAKGHNSSQQGAPEIGSGRIAQLVEQLTLNHGS